MVNLADIRDEEQRQEWCREQGLRVVDLGGAIGAPPGYETYDRQNADIVGDLNDDWALEDSSVGLLRAHDLIEHLRDPIHTMNEAFRVVAPGGIVDILVPSTDGRGAWCDPTHVSFWNIRSFRYYTEPEMRKYLEPECRCLFRILTLQNRMLWEGIPYVVAELTPVK
jgi:SAM-dependent methyltransferase